MINEITEEKNSSKKVIIPLVHKQKFGKLFDLRTNEGWEKNNEAKSIKLSSIPVLQPPRKSILGTTRPTLKPLNQMYYSTRSRQAFGKTLKHMNFGKSNEISQTEYHPKKELTEIINRYLSTKNLFLKLPPRIQKLTDLLDWENQFKNNNSSLKNTQLANKNLNLMRKSNQKMKKRDLDFMSIFVNIIIESQFSERI